MIHLWFKNAIHFHHLFQKTHANKLGFCLKYGWELGFSTPLHDPLKMKLENWWTVYSVTVWDVNVKGPCL